MVLRMNGSFSGLKKYIKAQTEAIVCVGRGKKRERNKKTQKPKRQHRTSKKFTGDKVVRMVTWRAEKHGVHSGHDT